MLLNITAKTITICYLLQTAHYVQQYSETCLERPLPWKTTCREGPVVGQKVLHFSVNKPVTKDHLSWETVCLWPMGWSFKTGSTVHTLPGVLNTGRSVPQGWIQILTLTDVTFNILTAIYYCCNDDPILQQNMNNNPLYNILVQPYILWKAHKSSYSTYSNTRRIDNNY